MTQATIDTPFWKDGKSDTLIEFLEEMGVQDDAEMIADVLPPKGASTEEVQASKRMALARALNRTSSAAQEGSVVQLVTALADGLVGVSTPVKLHGASGRMEQLMVYMEHAEFFRAFPVDKQSRIASWVMNTIPLLGSVVTLDKETLHALIRVIVSDDGKDFEVPQVVRAINGIVKDAASSGSLTPELANNLIDAIFDGTSAREIHEMYKTASGKKVDAPEIHASYQILGDGKVKVTMIGEENLLMPMLRSRFSGVDFENLTPVV